MPLIGNRVGKLCLWGTMRFERGDMLLTGVKGEIYPCKIDIFLATYEKVGLKATLKFGGLRTWSPTRRSPGHSYRAPLLHKAADVACEPDDGQGRLALLF